LSFSAPLWVAVLGLVLLLDARTRQRSRSWQFIVAATGSSLFLATLIASLAGSQRVLAGVAGAATLVLVVMVSVSIVRSLANRPVVELSTVLGVLNVYLLLALVFASVHQILAAVQAFYLNGVDGFPTSSDLLYFSVITMTTVGFGDLTPGTNLARTVTVTEALIGQLYLVSVVAARVGGWGAGVRSGHPRRAATPRRSEPVPASVGVLRAGVGRLSPASGLPQSCRALTSASWSSWFRLVCSTVG
jgi:hypothetical protein